MKLKALAAAALVVTSVPIAMQEADGQTAARPAEKRYCTVTRETGSRLGGVRRCRTKAEQDAYRAEAQKSVERIQSQKNWTQEMVQMRSTCPGSGNRWC